MSGAKAGITFVEVAWTAYGRFQVKGLPEMMASRAYHSACISSDDRYIFISGNAKTGGAFQKGEALARSVERFDTLK